MQRIYWHMYWDTLNSHKPSKLSSIHLQRKSTRAEENHLSRNASTDILQAVSQNFTAKIFCSICLENRPRAIWPDQVPNCFINTASFLLIPCSKDSYFQTHRVHKSLLRSAALVKVGMKNTLWAYIPPSLCLHLQTQISDFHPISLCLSDSTYAITELIPKFQLPAAVYS